MNRLSYFMVIFNFQRSGQICKLLKSKSRIDLIGLESISSSWSDRLASWVVADGRVIYFSTSWQITITRIVYRYVELKLSYWKKQRKSWRSLRNGWLKKSKNNVVLQTRETKGRKMNTAVQIWFLVIIFLPEFPCSWRHNTLSYQLSRSQSQEDIGKMEAQN